MTDLVKANKGQFKKAHKVQPKVPSQLKHGMGTRKVRDPFYASWCRMKRRCLNKNSKEYATYGAKGIGVSPDWLSFEGFYADMRPTWFPGASLDRIDNGKGYSPNNCRWVTMADQARNKTTVRTYMWGTEKLTIPQIADQMGIKPKTLYARIVIYKWPLERAFKI